MIERFPTKIRVTSRKTYEVHWTKGFEDPKKVGECHPVTRVITLRLGEPESETWWTLFHEILHAINFERRVGMTERQVTEVERSLMKIFGDLGWVIGKQPRSRSGKASR